MKTLHFKSTMRAEEGGVIKAELDLVGAGAPVGECSLSLLESTSSARDVRAYDPVQDRVALSGGRGLEQTGRAGKCSMRLLAMRLEPAGVE